jgi:DNA integrity scanning protein DisA with diadenylate cyclase activity
VLANEGTQRNLALSQLKSDVAALSELSAVDGCVVLSRDLKLIGFGGEIQVSDDESRLSSAVFTRLSGEVFEDGNYQSILESLGGTRHRSAARLCRVVDDVTVFVVSQDGDLKMICNRENGVYPYGPMDTRYMGASVD